jgi:hypothetical protein
MKSAVVLLCLLLVATNFLPTSSAPMKSKFLRVPLASVKLEPNQGIGCPVCVTFFDNTLGDLLNIILNLGIGAGCGTLCTQLPQPLEQAICEFLCVAVGFEAFVDLLNSTDIDPIYLCTEMDVCPANTCATGCVTIDSVAVQPKSGPVRTTFNVEVIVHALQNTGTGVTRVVVNPPGGGQPFAVENLNEGWQAGTVNNVTVAVETDWEDWTFPPGQYPIEIDSCAYDCDDQHGIYFATKYSSFVITGN